ncbi:MAG: hypothetical protein HXY18_16375 [Bryobacteraceae bacterium]|nr:hypothetical protein [Bryobacteraceae bacterium]
MRSIKMVLLFCLLVFPAFAEDLITGEWTYKMDTPMGESTAALTLKVEDGKLTGKFVFEADRVLEISEGTVEGDTLKFTVKRNRAEGGSMTYKMTGKVDGRTIKGSATAVEMPDGGEMAWSATKK